MVVRRLAGLGLLVALGLGVAGVRTGVAQDEEEHHGRKYKAPPETTKIDVTVLKDVTGKPIPNAAVIFHPIKDGHDDGNLEIKTGPDGKASIDVIPMGSTVGLQVIASGYETYGDRFDLKDRVFQATIRMRKPVDQVSAYDQKHGLGRSAGVQEPERVPMPKSAKPLAAGAPLISISDAQLSTLSGRVTDKAGVPVADATVTLENGDKPPTVVKTTDDGRYAAVNLIPGKYTVRMEAPGYKQLRNEVALSTAGSKTLDGVLAQKK